MLRKSVLLLAAAAAHLVLADVEFTSPSAGATLTGGSTISVKWKDSGTSPPISDLLTYQLFLCAGGNDAGSFVSLTPLVFVTLTDGRLRLPDRYNSCHSKQKEISAQETPLRVPYKQTLEARTRMHSKGELLNFDERADLLTWRLSVS